MNEYNLYFVTTNVLQDVHYLYIDVKSNTLTYIHLSKWLKPTTSWKSSMSHMVQVHSDEYKSESYCGMCHLLPGSQSATALIRTGSKSWQGPDFTRVTKQMGDGMVLWQCSMSRSVKTTKA